MGALEKIEWMIETDGYALEVVAPDPAADPPQAGFSSTPSTSRRTCTSPTSSCSGSRRSHARGLIGLVRDFLLAGTDIPVGVELVGLLDNELRCCFAPVDLPNGDRCSTPPAPGTAATLEIVQLVYPDRNGFLPYEAGFDQRRRFAQPVIGPVLDALTVLPITQGCWRALRSP